MTTLLEVTDLRTRFQTPEGMVYAVNGISYALDEGETLAVVGESGCGKSVSMMSILGLIPQPPGDIYAGHAMYRGIDLLAIAESQLERIRGREIGMIFQDPMTSLNPVLTIKRQLTESLKRHMAMNDEQAARRAVELMEAVGIPDSARRLSDYPHQFSGGMRQRVMIAMALACAPSILIADEPTTALDVTIQAQIVELAIKMREQMGMAMIWITHDLGVVAGIARRVLVMYAGFIVEEAGIDSLYDDPRHPYTLALLAALPRADRRRDHRLKSIPGAPPSLHVQPRGCPFAPRCEYAIERCWEENPALMSVDDRRLSSPLRSEGLREATPADDHRIACWVNVNTGAAR